MKITNNNVHGDNKELKSIISQEFIYFIYRNNCNIHIYILFVITYFDDVVFSGYEAIPVNTKICVVISSPFIFLIPSRYTKFTNELGLHSSCTRVNSDINPNNDGLGFISEFTLAQDKYKPSSFVNLVYLDGIRIINGQEITTLTNKEL